MKKGCQHICRHSFSLEMRVKEAVRIISFATKHKDGILINSIVNWG